MSGVGSRVSDFGFRVSDFGSRVSNLGFRDSGGRNLERTPPMEDPVLRVVGDRLRLFSREGVVDRAGRRQVERQGLPWPGRLG